MATKSTATLTAQNSTDISGQTTPEIITPVLLGGDLQDIIDSMYNRIDDALTPAPISRTRAQIATLIGASSLNDKQWILVNDRADGFPLYILCNGTNKISPYGIWVKSAKPLAVIMDYTGTYEGETLPFIAMFDENRKLNLPNQIVIADGSEGTGKVLVSDANGKSTWKIAANYQNPTPTNPASMAGASSLMMGLAGAITPTKTGKVLICISGAFVAAFVAGVAITIPIELRTGTGVAPINGAAATGTINQTVARASESATLAVPFSMNVIVSLTVGTPYWIDISTNTGSGTVEFFGISISAIEQ